MSFALIIKIKFKNKEKLWLHELNHNKIHTKKNAWLH